ncbi:splicing regulatory glutamine/lysine-rich protein 1 [Phlebotomus argentipes]|uniref:splicing regulatory glutamine/lysine-rich protein 1 n=1 Tax=Phlebotomus argentipes TaxID=94469 RepID=UPI0028929CCF|nr:splicing regulatory glutamine/lysine-rich protein 1 [Phlebotomus argentipes]
MTEEDKFDIYGDLNDFDASVKLKQTAEELEVLQKKHSEIVKSLEASEAVNRHTKAVNSTIKKNFSILLATVRAEVKRKDGTIAQLRRDFDDLAFRRNKMRSQASEKVSKSTQTDLKPDGRSNRYDRFKESLHQDQGYKRRHDGSDRDAHSSSKKRRSRPRSLSRDRNRYRRRDSSRERRIDKRDTRSDRKSRERTAKTEKTAEKTVKTTKEVPKDENVQQVVKKSEDTSVIVENSSTSEEKNGQDDQGVEQKVSTMLSDVQEKSAIPETPKGTKDLPTKPESLKDPEEFPQNKSINLGNSDYTIESNNNGVVTVFIKRKKRKCK